MPLESKHSSVRTLAVLHPVFALTGVLHAVGGALLPSLAVRFHLSDSTSGLLFLLYFAGTSLGALLCRGSYARLMTIGFTAIVCTCLAVAASPRFLLAPAFLLLGVSVGVPMSAVTLFIGRNFPERCAPLLTILNFSWSIGALAAPLIAARILMRYDYRAAYILFSIASAIAAVVCGLILRDNPEPTSFISGYSIINYCAQPPRHLRLCGLSASGHRKYRGCMAADVCAPHGRQRPSPRGCLLFVLLGRISFFPRSLVSTSPAYRPCTYLSHLDHTGNCRSFISRGCSFGCHSQHGNVSARSSSCPHLSSRPRRNFRADAAYGGLALDTVHCRLRRLRSSLGRRIYINAHRQSPHWHDIDPRRVVSHGIHHARPSILFVRGR